MGPTLPKRKFLMVVYVVQKSFWNMISFFSNFDGTHIPKKEFLMAYISIPKIILKHEFPFLVILIAYVYLRERGRRLCQT